MKPLKRGPPAPRVEQSGNVNRGSTTLPGYTVFYDANCHLCARSRRTLERLRPRAELMFVDVRNPEAMRQYPMVDHAASLGQMFVLDPAGGLTGGYDGFVSLAPTIPFVRRFRHILRWKVVRFFGRRIYRFVAHNRYRLWGAVSCGSGACAIVQPRIEKPRS